MDKKLIDVHSLHATGHRYCPVCMTISDHFEPMNDRQNAKCPCCGSLERHRGQMLWLMNDSSFFKDRLRVLHVAPERKLRRIFKSLRNINYMSCDRLRNLADLVIDIRDIIFKDEVFDVVICNHVLEHIEDDRKAIGELYRVLKRGGWAILSVPIFARKTYEDPSVRSPADRLRVFRQKDHVRLCGEDYYLRFEEAGFKTEFINYGNYSVEEKTVLGLLDAENGPFYICRKE